MKKIYLVLFVILSIFVFSCKDNLISDDLSSSQNSGAGQVKVFVKQSRLIGPELSDVSWDVLLRKDNENDTISGKNENGYYLFSGLSDGTYNITVFGKIDDVEKFTGSAKVTITNGNSVSVNVPIVAKKTENGDDTERTGYATITMDMSDKLLSLLNSMVENPNFNANLSISRDGTDANITASLVKISTDEQGENVSIEFFDNQEVKFENYSSNTNLYEIPTGYYYLTFSDLGSFTIKLKDDLVEIGDGLTTNIVLTENDYEIVEYYSSILYVNNEGGETADGKTLSNPIAFSTITEDNYEDLIYLLSDVDFVYDTGTKNLCPNLGRFFGTISSFGSSLYTIKADIYSYTSTINLGVNFPITLKNVKLSGSNKFCFSNLFVDETVILDCEMDNDSTVQLSKKSNLQIGQNFSGDLYVSLFGDWKLGDTVINFENGKPENSNFYIDSECENSSGQKYSAMFYIDDSGKLAKYTDDFTSFAWSRTVPYLVTKTQAKNKTMTTILNSSEGISDFTGVSTYDHENNTWYFIGGDSARTLYSVKSPEGYESSVDAIDTDLSEIIGIYASVKAMSYNNGYLYLLCLTNTTFEIYKVSGDECKYLSTLEIGYASDLTALLVDGYNFYIATDYIENPATTGTTTTHSAIWKYTLLEDTSGNGVYYHLIPVDSYVSEDREYPVPYYLTQYDDNLAINTSFPEGSTFRITDLYSDGTSVYGLLANYIEKEGEGSVGEDDKNKSFMRGSVFKLITNSERVDGTSAPIMNATQLGLRKSFPLTSDDLATAKQDFILPRKIVGILNKKLVIVDDGMVPDSNGCNVDRFVLFDLAGEISETIDVGISFTTQASVSSNKFFTFDPLFDAQ